MLLIIDKNTGAILQNHGTNSLFPYGDIPGITVNENELAVRCHDDSFDALAIMNAHECTIVPKHVEIKRTELVLIENEEAPEDIDNLENLIEPQFEEIEIVVDSYYVVDTVTVTKTKDEYLSELPPVFDDVDEEKLAMAEAIIDLDTRLSILEGGV